tara:strand:- start:240 stop:497 length:258 start_codon:yes stop_codon:yes gene_type:complete
MSKPHPYKKWKDLVYVKEKAIDKNKLREDINRETEIFLKNNKIKVLESSPSQKVASVRVRELGGVSDTEEFYYLEEQDETNNQKY